MTDEWGLQEGETYPFSVHLEDATPEGHIQHI